MNDTMCAKTTETSRCQRCGSEFDWLSDGTKIHAGKQYFESDSLLCLERQLNAANAKIKQLEDNRTKAAANSLANMLAYEEAIAKIKRLEEALVKIIKEVPAHDGCGGLFLPRFDGDGNEIGVQAVDPIKVIGAMHARALDAISRQCA